jgi:hypothetical protein
MKKMKCARCGKEVICYIMSFFNTDNICLECEKKEKAHPRYAEARRVELEEVKKGNYNFPGIGKPGDL